VRAEASLALKRAVDAESGLKSLCSYIEKTKASTRTGVERAHTLFVDAYHELGAWTAFYDRSSKEVGLCFLGWLQEELESLPSIAMASCPTPRLLPARGRQMPCPVRDASISKSSTRQPRTSTVESSRSKTRC
jgi:hypothetical protein